MWTTTPWTLPANVAATVKPDAEYVWVEHEGERLVVARERCEAVFGADARIVGSVRGEELVGRPYATGFDDLPAQGEVTHRVVADSAIVLDEGTGIVHIAPGCGAEDFEIGRREELPVLVPVDEAGLFVEGYGELVGHGAHEVPELVVAHLEPGGWLLRQEPYEHRYPHCWRCGTEADLPRRRRVVHPLRRDPPADDRRQSHRRVDAVALRQAHGGLAAQHGRLVHLAQALLGPAAAVLVLPRRAPHDHLLARRSCASARRRASRGCSELHRPWIDPVTIDCAECGAEATRVPEVGDCWLDAGIVPFSTLGYRARRSSPRGTRRARGSG